MASVAEDSADDGRKVGRKRRRRHWPESQPSSTDRRLIVEALPFTNRFDVYSQWLDGRPGALMARAQRAFFLQRADFYADPGCRRPMFGFREVDADGTMAVVQAPDGEGIGTFRKHYWKSLIRSTWCLSIPDGLTAVGKERSLGAAVIRRVSTSEWVKPDLIVDFVTAQGDVALTHGPHQGAVTTLGCRLTIPMLPDGRQLDWRMGAAIAVALLMNDA